MRGVRREIGLSRERVCAEALALVDEEGLEALSMRRLGARIGCEAMSLYRHVKDKADLLDALHAAVLGDLEPEEPTDQKRHPQWRALLGGLARALRSALLRHPNVLPLFTTRPVSAPEAVATVARVHGALLGAGFSARDTERSVMVVGMFTIGHAVFEKHERRDATFRFGLDALLDGIERDQRAHRRRK
ncbi:MAG TPA: TetR/AcrR family transcriptional regulator C-terminal domain-containing protein [Polyangia bacterium]